MLGLIVERDLHKRCVETLARKTVAQLHPASRLLLATIRVGDAPWQRFIFPEVVSLLERGCQHVLVVFDTHTTDAQDIASQVRTIRGPLAAAGLMDRVVLLPVAPSILHWLLADRAALAQVAEGPVPRHRLRRSDDLPAFLEALFGQEPSDKLEALLAQLDPSRIAHRDACFAEFQRHLAETLSRGGSSLMKEDSAAT
jgi:hypothetical protein